jgi:hypothetical protein
MFNLRVFKILLYFLSLSLIQACGVKGKPQPPQKPPYIGTGINGTPTVNKDSIKEINQEQIK